jgi:hypothetical protein
MDKMDKFDLARAKKSKPVGPSVYSFMGGGDGGHLQAVFAGSDAGLSPEARLMLAVLEDAIAQYQRNFNGRPIGADQFSSDAEAWIQSDEIEWPFSFLNICQVLDMDAGYLRRGLHHWSRRAIELRDLIRVTRRVNGSRHSISAKRLRARKKRSKEVVVEDQGG